MVLHLLLDLPLDLPLHPEKGSLVRWFLHLPLLCSASHISFPKAMKSPSSLSVFQAQWLKRVLIDRHIERRIGRRMEERCASHRFGGAIAGFTLLELLVVMIMVGVLAALAGPSWVSFANNQRLGAAQDAALRSLREGQAKARQQKVIWEVCFRDTGDSVDYSAHQAGSGGCENASWEPLLGETDAQVQISNSTTSLVGGGPYQVQFNGRGWMATQQDGPQYGANEGNVGERLGFAIRDQDNTDTYSCVFVDTLLGALRVERNDACANNG